jgi:hypothetical protein
VDLRYQSIQHNHRNLSIGQTVRCNHNVAGGWAGGNVAAGDLLSNTVSMVEQSMFSLGSY